MKKFKLKVDVLWYKKGTVFEIDNNRSLWIYETDGLRLRTLDQLQNAIANHFEDDDAEEYFEEVVEE